MVAAAAGSVVRLSSDPAIHPARDAGRRDRSGGRRFARASVTVAVEVMEILSAHRDRTVDPAAVDVRWIRRNAAAVVRIA
jgi:hypothetical protein